MGKSQSRVTLRKVNCVSGAWCAPWDESLGVRLHSRNNVDSTGENGRSCILQSGKDSRPVLAFPFVGLLMADGKTTPWGSLDVFGRSFGGSFAAWDNGEITVVGVAVFLRVGVITVVVKLLDVLAVSPMIIHRVESEFTAAAQYSPYSQHQKLYTKKNLVSPLTLIRIILT